MIKSHHANADSVLAVWGKGSTQARWSSPAGYERRGFNEGTMAAVSLALTLKLHNSVFPVCLWYLPRCYLSARAQGECLWVSLCASSVKRCLDFSCLPSHLDSQNPHWFSQPDYVGTPGLKPGLGSSGVGPGPLTPSREALQPKCPLLHSTTTCICGTGLIFISISPTSLNVVSFSHPLTSDPRKGTYLQTLWLQSLSV